VSLEIWHGNLGPDEDNVLVIKRVHGFHREKYPVYRTEYRLSS